MDSGKIGTEGYWSLWDVVHIESTEMKKGQDDSECVITSGNNIHNMIPEGV